MFQNRDLITLASLIAIIIVFPIFEKSAVADILFVSLFSLLLLATLYEVSDHPRQVGIGILLAIPILLSAWTNLFLPEKNIWVAELIATAVFLTYILLAILKRVLAAREVTLTEIIRAVNVYIMIAMAFGVIYLFIDLFAPGSFQFTYGEKTMSAVFYFSFVVLSTAGFGDITAIAPVARSVVTIEMIIGVMFMAVFIGLLVNAHYSTRYASRQGEEPKRARDALPETRPERLPLFSSGGPLSLIAIAVMLNLATSITMGTLRLPIYMDTWGTSLVVMTGGFWIGAAAGILYNLVMAYAFWGPASALWATSSILVAAATWFFWRRGWIDLKKPFMLGAAGIITGLLNTCLVIGIGMLFHLPETGGILVVRNFLSGIAGNPAMGEIVIVGVMEITDKVISLLLAAVMAVLLNDILNSYRPDTGD